MSSVSGFSHVLGWNHFSGKQPRVLRPISIGSEPKKGAVGKTRRRDPREDVGGRAENIENHAKETFVLSRLELAWRNGHVSTCPLINGFPLPEGGTNQKQEKPKCRAIAGCFLVVPVQ